MNSIKAYWQHLVTREKALIKSLTVWFAAVLAAAPNLLTTAQANFPSISPYLPHLLEDQGMKWIALGIFVCRMKSLVKVPAAPLPAPDPNASRP